jgi:TldD protein
VIEEAVVSRVLGAALQTGGDFAEVFVEDKRSSSGRLDDGQDRGAGLGRDRGAGIRVVVGDTTGFAHTADLSEAGLLAAAEAAAAAARGGGGGVKHRGPHRRPVTLAAVATRPEEVAKATKVELLQRANEVARSKGDARSSRCRRPTATAAAASWWPTPTASSPADDQTRTLFVVGVVASGDTGMQTGRRSVGHTMGFELFDRYQVEDLARRGGEQALTKLRARPAPSRPLPVVIGKGGGGVLFHEACGHGLEADHIQKKVSVFAGPGRRARGLAARHHRRRRHDGQRVGHLRHRRRGHARPAQRAHRGRRAHRLHVGPAPGPQGGPPALGQRPAPELPAPPDGPHDQHLSSPTATPTRATSWPTPPNGVYVAHLGGGQVNTATGDFVFGMTEAYLIEDGKITEPLREGNLIGNGPEVLELIDAVGNDFEMGPPGTCGKDGQGVPVGDGVPTLRVSRLTVGGTAA